MDDVGCGPDLEMDDVGCGPDLEMDVLDVALI